MHDIELLPGTLSAHGPMEPWVRGFPDLFSNSFTGRSQVNKHLAMELPTDKAFAYAAKWAQLNNPQFLGKAEGGGGEQVSRDWGGTKVRVKVQRLGAHRSKSEH